MERIPELLQRAFHIARSGVWPVLVALPHDMLEDEAEVEHEPSYRSLPPQPHYGRCEARAMDTCKRGRPVLSLLAEV